jgi:hypothetical protein
VEKGRGNHTRRFDVPLELEKLTFDAHPTELLRAGFPAWDVQAVGRTLWRIETF